MSNRIELGTLLADPNQSLTEKRSLFALLNLGILESLHNGSLSAIEAVERFFHADNCLFVREHLYDREVEAVMSHGVQLPDLFIVLPPQEAQREFQRELATMRALSLSLLEEKEFAT